jgi:hypothetical protein
MSLSRHPLTPNTQGLANIPVDSGTVALLAASFRAVQARGSDFADGFYARLFAAHPQVRPMFPADMTAQKAKLLDTLAIVMSAWKTRGASSAARLASATSATAGRPGLPVIAPCSRPCRTSRAEVEQGRPRAVAPRPLSLIPR